MQGHALVVKADATGGTVPLTGPRMGSVPLLSTILLKTILCDLTSTQQTSGDMRPQNAAKKRET